MWADDAVLKIKSSIFSTLIRPRLNYCCMPSLLLYALGSGEYLRGRCTPLVVGNIFGVDAPFKFVIMFQIDYFIFFRPYNDNSVGLISNPRLCLSEVEEGIEYSFQVFYNTIASGCCSNDMSEIECYLSQLLTTSSYAVCPGVREYPSCIQFKTKNLVVWKEPFNRYFSTKCSQWHIPNNVHQVHIPNSTAFNCCKACKQLIHDIRQLQRSSEAVSDTTRAQRRSASSQYSISRLSPESQAIRRADKIIKKQRKKKLSRLLPSTS